MRDFYIELYDRSEIWLSGFGQGCSSPPVDSKRYKGKKGGSKLHILPNFDEKEGSKYDIFLIFAEIKGLKYGIFLIFAKI